MSMEWRHDFLSFLRDMGTKPSPKHSLDRIDPNGDYCKGNCRWATDVQQVRNRRSTVTVGGEALGYVAESYGAKYATLHKRLMSGRPISPEIKNLGMKHRFYFNGTSMSIREVSLLIKKSYNHTYHKLVTNGVPLEELINAE